MRLIDYIKQTTSMEEKVVIPVITEENAEDSLPVHNTKLREAILNTIVKTGLSYNKLNEELKKRDIHISLATLHNIATNPHVAFGKYDTDVMLPILSDIKSNYQTTNPTAWIDRDTVQSNILKWLESPKIKHLAEKSGKSTALFLRDLVGLTDDRLTFSHWKNGRYKVKAEKWVNARKAVQNVLGKV